MFNKLEREIGYFICESEKTEYNRIVIAYIKYYHMRSRICKISFYAVSVLKLVLLGLMPVFQVMELMTVYPWLLTIFASGVIFLEACAELLRLQEKWLLYRDTCNRLLSVQRQYNATRGREPDAKTLEYIEAVEEIIGEEARQWVAMHSEKKSDIHEKEETL